MNRYELEKQMIRDAIAEFPSEFGLRAFPAERFTILERESYVSDGKVMLYTGIKKADGSFGSFAKGTPAELKCEVTE